MTDYLRYCSHVCITPKLVYLYAENPDSLCRQMYYVNEFNGTYLILYEAEKVVSSYISHEDQMIVKSFTLKHVETCIDILNRLAHFKLFHHEKVAEISKDIKMNAGQYLFLSDLYPKKWVNYISVLLIYLSPQLFMRVYYLVKKIAWKLGFRSKV